MKALVYHGPGQIQFEDKSKPKIERSTDCIVKISTTTICGTDLHILKGDVPSVEAGRTLGHEGVGIIEEVGSAVCKFKPQDKVLISCITSCGNCAYCKDKMYSHCESGGWLLGHKIDGTQAEYVRVPFADNSLHLISQSMDEEALCLFSDILPTGFETGVIKGKIKLGDTVAIIGSGPIGLAVLLTASFYSPAKIIVVDKDEFRLNVAKELGATTIIHETGEEAIKKILESTHQKGVDVAIEAVGSPEAFDVCQAILAPGGYLANIGVHGKSVNLHLENLWDRNITLTTALVDTYTTPTLIKTYKEGKLAPKKLITHSFQLKEIIKAYEVFAKSAQEHALKVILKNTL